MFESGLLRTLIEVLIKNALPIAAIYWLLERPFIEKVLVRLSDFIQETLGISISAVKRYVAILASILISTGMYTLYAGLGYAPMPSTFEGWADLILSIGAINFTGTQLVQSKDIRHKLIVRGEVVEPTYIQPQIE